MFSKKDLMNMEGIMMLHAIKKEFRQTECCQIFEYLN